MPQDIAGHQRISLDIMETPRMISRKKAAELLGYSVVTLQKWSRWPDLNGLPVHVSPTGRVRYCLDDVLAWIKKQRREPAE